MKITVVLFLFFLAVSLMSCDQDHEKPVNSEYIVLYTDINEFYEVPVAALYLAPENQVHHNTTLDIHESGRYYDGVISGDKLFTVTTDGMIRRSDVNSFQPEAEAPLFQTVDEFSNRNSPLMRTYEELILVAGRFHHELGVYHIYLKFYDENLILQDSIVIDGALKFLDIRTEGPRIYVSYIHGQDPWPALLVFENKDENPIFKGFDSPFSEIIIAGDSLLLAEAGGIRVLDKTSLDELTTFPIVALQDSISPHDYFAYEKSRHLLHFFSPASDNAPGWFHYTISSLDLKSGEVLPLAPEEDFVYPPIVYNSRLKTLTAQYLSSITNFAMDGSKICCGRPSYARLDKLLLLKE